MRKAGFLFILFGFLAGCYYDVEEELYPDNGEEPTEATFSGDVVPILEKDCYSCHDAANNFGGITLEGYDNVIRYVDNGRLLGAIRREQGFSPMPSNAPPLLETELAKIELWINDGALNN